MFISAFKLAACVTVAAACLAAPAAFAACENVAGPHHGHFDADKRSDSQNSGRPDNITGTWTATIDGATCEMTGQAETSFTGTVALKGTYDASDGGKFKVTNVSMDVADSTDYQAFAFETVPDQHLLHFVLIQTADYEYDGSFDGK